MAFFKMNNPEPVDIQQINIRRVRESDLEKVVALDHLVTQIDKPDYWNDIYARYSTRRQEERFFLVAESAQEPSEHTLLGFIVGEVRIWEFGSEPCGWVFAFSVDPDTGFRGSVKICLMPFPENSKMPGLKPCAQWFPDKTSCTWPSFAVKGWWQGHIYNWKKISMNS